MNTRFRRALMLMFALMFAVAVSACRPALEDGCVRLPVLMYHHFDKEAAEYTVVSAERFRQQMVKLKTAGYTAVTVSQLIEYVNEGTPLPEKPVLITMDDGYTSNLSIAARILEEENMCATVFVIGINEGETTYLHSGEPLYSPRFSYEEAEEWVEKGVLDVQSHSFDMHQLASYGYSGRDGMLRIEGETMEEYKTALSEDLEAFRRRREGRVSTELTALAYPFGYCSAEADQFLAENGIAVTFTIEEHANILRQGDPDSLRMLGRMNVTDDMSGKDLLRRLGRLEQK